MRPSIGLLGLVLLVAPTVLAQNVPDNNPAPAPAPAPAATTTQPTGDSKTTNAPAPAETSKPEDNNNTDNNDNKTDETSKTDEAKDEVTKTDGNAPSMDFTSAKTSESSSSTSSSDSSSSEETGSASGNPVFSLTGLSTLAGLGTPVAQVPNTAGAAFMQKSDLPDGTVFICVGAVLAFAGVAVLAWRALVAWALHRSVKRAAMAQNMADIKAMSAVPGKKRGMYNVVGASSNMSLDHLAAAPTGTSRPPKPFAANPGGTPPRSTSNLFFSPTAGGSTGLRDSMVNRSSTYLPAGYYASGNAQPAAGASATQLGGTSAAHLSTYSLQTPGNRISHRSGISPPGSPSLPPHGYERAPPSRDGLSLYNRNSVATLGTPPTRVSPYGQQGNPSQLSLNVPGGTDAPGGRAPSAYLEDLFENHGNGQRERY